MVVTPDGLLAAEVRGVVERPDGDLARETDLHGIFPLSELSVGTYGVRLGLVGYRPIRFDSVTVRLGWTITDPRLGATSSNLTYNFIRELERKTGGYEAEFGRATGGAVMRGI